MGYGMALQSNGKILLSGCSIPNTGLYATYSIIRVEADGGPANFTASNSLVCVGSTVQFTSVASLTGFSYQWTFEGGTPSTSTLQNPLVTYDVAGSYNVKLKVFNSIYADSLTKANMIEVKAAPASPVISGLHSVCESWSSDYQTVANPGSSYSWIVTQGTVVNGAGTSNITVLWGSAGNGSITVTETNNNDCIATSQVFDVAIDPCTGIDEPANITTLKVYPNPAREAINISSPDLIHRIYIYNSMGALVDILQVNNSNYRIKSCNLSEGLYILKIETDKGLVTIRVSVVK
jgi:PKD repeat protein